MVHRCASCDLEFVHPLPSADELERFYHRGYFTGGGSGFGYVDYFDAEHRVARNKAEHRIARMREAGLPAGGKVLDVGCADGTFVNHALSQGFDAYGVEVSDEARRHTPDALRARIVASLGAAAAYAPFHAITFWDVLEHLPDPLATLREAKALLAPSGLLGAVVPVIDNVNARVLPRTWDQYKPPEHLWFFSRRSLRSLLGREVGELALEEGAWRRDSRCIEALTEQRTQFSRMAADVERVVVRALVRIGVVPGVWVEDSMLMLARAPAERPTSGQPV